MHSSVPYTGAGLCADVQLNSAIFFRPIIVACALFPPGPSIVVILCYLFLFVLDYKWLHFSLKIPCHVKTIYPS